MNYVILIISAGVGKTSLIMALVSEEFVREVSWYVNVLTVNSKVMFISIVLIFIDLSKNLGESIR